MERAAGRRVGGIGHLTDQRLDAAGRLDRRVGDRHRLLQRLRVRVQRLVRHRRPRPQLDHPPEVHHGDAVGDVADHAEVVGDEHVGDAELVAQVRQQVHDPRLHRDVERRQRLVEDDDLGLDGERAGDADALALTAGELVREAPGEPRRQADEVEQGLDPPTALVAAANPWTASTSSSVRPTVIRGLSEAYGSWNTNCTRRRNSPSARWPRPVTSRPSSSMCPDDAAKANDRAKFTATFKAYQAKLDGAYRDRLTAAGAKIDKALAAQ